jgi:hypothetical protein
METLRLYYPAKPYKVTQRWGIYNPAYLQFGFDMHNGEDCEIGTDKIVHCPVPAKALETGYNDGAGYYVRLRSTQKYIVGDKACYVWFMVMHLEKHLCKAGDSLGVGDPIGIADHTGFSTGPHIHITYRRVDEYNTQLDLDPRTNNSFDPHPYWTGIHAQDFNTIVGLYQQVAFAAASLVAQLMKRTA